MISNSEIALRAAAGGAVLLKNRGNVLPFAAGKQIALLGRDCFDYIKCGGGSACVLSEYEISVAQGLINEQRSGHIKISPLSLECDKNEYTPEILKKIGAQGDTAVICIARRSGEGSDRKNEKGDFLLSDGERRLFDAVQSEESIKNVVLLLNIGGVMDMRFIDEYDKIAAAMIIWFGGMEGGAAAAKLLCGEYTPSGRLCDTVAETYSDYPSSQTFDASDTFVRYEEDIFVGYRYFETFCPERVRYPFGFGLSYTEFERVGVRFSYDENSVLIRAAVKNVGKYPGAQVVQAYVSAPDGGLCKPAAELKGFNKTRVLNPGETQTVEIKIEIASLASFDDSGESGFVGCWVLESGEYEFYLGDNVRDRQKCGSLFIEQTTVTERCGLKMSSPIERRLTKNGVRAYSIGDRHPSGGISPTGEKPAEKVTLFDVSEGKADLDSLIAQLTDRELIELCGAQPPAFPRGTAGIGNLKKYGVPNAQTADGPNGLRRTVPTTCFPCGMVLGCSFDRELIEQVGGAIAREGVGQKIDILLAPGLCIHRDPLCGRNFEYFSEDPVLSGICASAFVRGVQQNGMCATVKHFCCNNREQNRYYSDSIVSERAIREIYLRGFEIAVKTADPAFVMTSYNLVNSKRTSANRNLLCGILRDEWGFSGAVMTDWRVPSHQFEEIMAGNDIKMPYGYSDELALTDKKVDDGVVTRAMLEECARAILTAVMRTDRFKRRDLGNEYEMGDKTRLSALDFTAVTGTWLSELKCEDEGGGYCLSDTAKDFRGNDVEVYYDVNVKTGGIYLMTARVDSPYESSWLEIRVDDKPVGFTGHIDTRRGSDRQVWDNISTKIELPQGEHKLSFVIRDSEFNKGFNINWFELELIR